MNNIEVMLTTIDNPFNPFTHLEEWRLFDIEKQHFTCELIGSLINLSEEMSPFEEYVEHERVYDEIIKYDHEDKFQKIYHDTTNNTYKLANEITQDT